MRNHNPSEWDAPRTALRAHAFDRSIILLVVGMTACSLGAEPPLLTDAAMSFDAGFDAGASDAIGAEARDAWNDDISITDVRNDADVSITTDGTAGAGGGPDSDGSGGSTGGNGGAAGSDATTGGAGGGTGGSAGSTGGAGDATGGTGGSDGSGGSAGSGGTAGSGGSAGGSDAGSGTDAGGDCPTYTNFTLGIHITMDVKWDRTLTVNAGTGKVHLWNRAKLTATGNQIAGTVIPCGLTLPDITLNPEGEIAAGGERVSIETPFAAWDAPSIPAFEQKGTFGGWAPGSDVEMDYTIALVGLTMTDAFNAPWPETYTSIMGMDAEMDGRLGMTAIPKNGNGYVYPPTSLGVLGSTPAADRLYIASRTVLALKGKLMTCEEQAGNVAVKWFDNHMIGCHNTQNAECDADQVKFIDDSRTMYQPTTAATFLSRKVADNATCAEVRAALP